MHKYIYTPSQMYLFVKLCKIHDDQKRKEKFYLFHVILPISIVTIGKLS